MSWFENKIFDNIDTSNDWKIQKNEINSYLKKSKNIELELYNEINSLWEQDLTKIKGSLTIILSTLKKDTKLAKLFWELLDNIEDNLDIYLQDFSSWETWTSITSNKYETKWKKIPEMTKLHQDLNPINFFEWIEHSTKGAIASIKHWTESIIDKSKDRLNKAKIW